jgi:ribokinase
MQLEIPMKVVVAAAKAARGTVIVNAAPAIPLPEELVEHIDVLIVNEHERDVALGRQTARHVPVIITTLGADGASVEGDFGAVNVAAPQVSVVDTTGAGDTFCGAVAEALARCEGTMDAVAWGVQAGALATTGLGARGAMPTLVDMKEHSREQL